MPGGEHACDALVRAVDGQRVLDEVVRADREEIDFLGEDLGLEGGRRHLDHDADRDVVVVFDALVLEVLGDVADDALGLAKFGDVGDQGKKHLDVAGDGGAEDRADLRLEQVEVLEAETDAPAAEHRVALALAVAGLRVLVGAEVDRANDDGLGAALLDDLAVGLVVVLLGGLGVAAEEEELRAIEPDAASALVVDLGDLLGELDVAQEGDLVPVGRDGGQLLEGLEAADELDLLPGAVLELGEGLLVGVDDDEPARAVDDDGRAAGSGGR